MKIKNISKNNLSFPLKKRTGQKIVTFIKPDEFVFSEDDSKKTENQQLIIYERKKLIQITADEKPDDMEYYKSYSEQLNTTEVEYFNPSLDAPVTPNEDINEANFDEEEEIIPFPEEEMEVEDDDVELPVDEELIGPQIIPTTPDVEPELTPNEIKLQENPISSVVDKLKEDMMNISKVPDELLKSPLDNGPTMEFAGGIRENMNTIDIPEVVTVTDSTEPKPKHAGGRPKGVKNKPTDTSKKKKDHRKNWKFLKK